MGGGKAPKEYIKKMEEKNNKKLFGELTLENKILKELKRDEIADDIWLDNHRLEAIKLTLKEREKILKEEIKFLETWLEMYSEGEHRMLENEKEIFERIKELKTLLVGVQNR